MLRLKLKHVSKRGHWSNVSAYHEHLLCSDNNDNIDNNDNNKTRCDVTCIVSLYLYLLTDIIYRQVCNIRRTLVGS